MDLLYFLVGKTHPPDHARRKILYQDVELRDHRHDQLARPRALHIDREAQLAVVMLHVIGAVAAGLVIARFETRVADAIAAGGQFQLNDFRAQLGHEASASWSCHELGKIEDAIPFEHPWCICHDSESSEVPMRSRDDRDHCHNRTKEYAMATTQSNYPTTSRQFSSKS